MPFNPPNLSEILTNEQTLNTNLITFRNELRNALDTLGIEYQSSDTILDLIRLLDWPVSKAIDIDGTFNNEQVLDLISNRIAMVAPAESYDPEWDDGWQLMQSKASPDYRFIPYTLAAFGGGSASGNATGVWVFTNEETSHTLNEDWTYECYIHPASGRSGTDVYRGLAVLLGNNWNDYGTYQGWCAGISLQGSTYKAFKGTWESAASPTMNNLNGSIYAGDTYHIKMRHIASAHTIYVYVYWAEDGEDYDQVAYSTISVRNLTTDFSQEVRFGMLSKFYAYESPLYGPGYPMSNVRVV